MKIVFKKKPTGGVTMSREEGLALRKKIITELQWQQYVYEASQYIQRNRSAEAKEGFIWKSGFDVAAEHGKDVYLHNNGKYWCVGVVVQESTGGIKVFAAGNNPNTLSGQRVYIEDGDILYTEKDEALPKSKTDEDGFEEVESDLEKAYNNVKENVTKAASTAGSLLGGLIKELAETANTIATDVANQVSERLEKAQAEAEAKKKSENETTSDGKTEKKESTVDKTIRFYQIVRLKSHLASLNKKKSDIEVDIEKTKKQIDALEKESVND